MEKVTNKMSVTKQFLLILWVIIRLTLVTAMLNRDIANFVYEGF